MTNQSQKKLSRRDAIKLLGAAAGATMLANLPSKWSTPELTSGVLPAHAQTSITGLTILDCELTVNRDGTWSSTPHIGPVPQSIAMRFTLTFVNMWFTSNNPGPQIPNPFVGTWNTDLNGDVLYVNSSNGAAGLDTLVNDPNANNGSFTVLWQFNDPSQGSGSCSRTYTWV